MFVMIGMGGMVVSVVVLLEFWCHIQRRGRTHGVWTAWLDGKLRGGLSHMDLEISPLEAGRYRSLRQTGFGFHLWRFKTGNQQVGMMVSISSEHHRHWVW